jgi:hypothetical protein
MINAEPVGVTDSVAVLTALVSQRYEERKASFRSLGEEVHTFLLEEAARHAEESIQGFSDFLSLHRLGKHAKFSDETRLLWTMLWYTGMYIPLYKWATAVPLASMAGIGSGISGSIEFCELPPSPSWLPTNVDVMDVLFPDPPIRRVVRTRLRERDSLGQATKRALRLAWSLLGLKSLMPPMQVHMVKDQLEDHKSLLSTPPPPLTGMAHAILSSVGEAIARMAFGNFTRYEELPQARLSASAGFVKFFDMDTKKYVSAEGTRAAQLEKLGGWTAASELTHMLYNPRTGVTPVYQVPYQFDWRDWDFDPKVQVVALQEPFKIRTISIADGPATAAGSRIQKAWHDAMRSLRPFQLIGGSTVVDALQSIDWRPWDNFVSGDYSAATDRLSSSASRVVFDALTANLLLPADLRGRLAQGLFSSEVDYTDTLKNMARGLPKKYVDSIKVPTPFVQVNGQLMGNILSFPILCLVNLAAWLDAWYTYWKRYPNSPVPWEILRVLHSIRDGVPLKPKHLDQLPLLVNGDDILFQSDGGRFYTVWRETIGKYGLKLSVGKNYISDRFLTINSQLFLFDEEAEEYTVRTAEEHFTDFRLGKVFEEVERPWWGGLLPDFYRQRTQIKRKFGLDVLTCDTRLIVHKVQEKFLLSLPEDLRELGNSLFIGRMHGAGLFDVYKGLNWYLPVQYGGLGLDPRGRTSTRVTEAQKRLAVRLAIHRGNGAPPSLSAEGSLPSEGVRRALEQDLPTRKVTGTPIVYRGRTLIDTGRTRTLFHVPRDGSVQLKVVPELLETVDSVIQRSRVIFTWLDYHTMGVRMDPDRIRRKVSDLLAWGMKISQAKSDHWFDRLDGRDVFRVVDRNYSGPLD